MAPTIERSTRLAISSDAVGSEVDSEVVLISIKTGRYFGLDTVGSEIWRRLHTETSFADLAAGLQSHFDGDGATIEAETLEFVAKLVDRGLVQIVSSSSDPAAP